MTRIKGLSDKSKFKNLNRNQFSLIGDHSCDNEYYLFRQKKYSSIQSIFYTCENLIATSQIGRVLRDNKCLGFFFKNISVFSPNSGFKILWDSLIFAIIVINLIYIPLKISFEGEIPFEDTFILSFLSKCSGWVFTLDIFIQFNCGYYRKGEVITDRKSIYYRNLSFKFWLNLLVFIFYQLQDSNNGRLMYSVSLFIRCYECSSLQQNFEEILNLKQN